MIISAIVARANNNAIGLNNGLPWHLPGDLKWLKEKTLNRHIIMGRKSFESLPKPLPKRTTIIVTRDKSYFYSGCLSANGIPQALALAHERGEKEVFILGGSEIYAQSSSLWDRFYLTEVDASPHADTFFPMIKLDQYDLVFNESHPADEKNQHPYTFKIYERNR